MVSKMSTIPSVSDFYKGADILITGATGFIGLVLIEKLLRSCPDLNRIYAIVRPKRGKSVQDRRGVFSDSELFADLLEQKPKILDKLELIEGDISLPGLGISAIDRKRLENVSVVFHSAASIRFDEPLKEAILGHVRATRDLLELVTTFKKVRAFVHVSTAFCNMDNGSLKDIKDKRLREVLYPDLDDWRKAIKLAENVDIDVLNILTKHFIKFSLNTYLYTKALGENVCKAYQDRVPLVIYRPSIVIAKAQEPLMGWATTLNGPCGLSIAGFMGLLRCVYGSLDSQYDMVFVDATVNGMIVSACKRHMIDKETAIYNSNAARASARDIMNNKEHLERAAPMSMSIWTCNVTDTNCKYNFILQSFLFHMLPAIIIDTVLQLSGQEPRLQRVQQKIHKTQMALAFFTRNSFEMQNLNYLQLSNVLNEADRKTFDTVMKDVVQESSEYMRLTQYCARKYILKDPDETIPAARRRLQRLKIADKLIRWTLFGGLVYKVYDYFLF